MTKMCAASAISIVAITCTTPGVLAIDEYRLDDGVKERGWGIQSGGSNSIAWLNTFTAQQGAETITDIRVVFGSGILGNNIPNGTPVDLYIWGDFNQDGSPDDAFVLDSTSGVVQGSGTNAFATYTLNNSITFNAGDTFFAGAIINYTGQFEVASIDEDGTDSIPNYPAMDHSWISGSANGVAIDPNNLDSSQFGLERVSDALYGGAADATWMIRLNAVPAPSAICLLLLGAPFVAARRR